MYCSPTKTQSPNLDVASLRKSFPIFQTHPDLIYFDSASTSQKPKEVIDEIVRYHSHQCSNSGRAAYSWSTQLDKSLTEVRQKMAAFIGAQAEDLAFTSGATESLNTVALSWGLKNLVDGDEIMLCPKDHSSAVLPWYNLKDILAAQGKQIKIKTFAIHEVGDYDLKSIKNALTERTRLIGLSHIHHVFGLDMEVSEIRDIVGTNVLISLDASQSVGHIKVDVQELKVDFLSFSGHKMFATTGTGGLWVNPRVKDSLQPCKLGGKSPAKITPTGKGEPGEGASEENSELSLDRKNTYAILEAGTKNIAGILSLGKAIDFIESIGLDAIAAHLSDLTVYLYNKLVLLPGIIFAPGMGICRCEKGFGIIAFRFEQISNLDLSFVLDEENIFVRSGDHCTYLKDQSEEFVRVSMHLYNSREEIDQLVAVLAEATG